MKKITFYLLVILCSTTVFAQIGIGTTTPEATLDINGTIQIRDTDNTCTSTKLLAVNDSGKVTKVVVGTNLSLNNNVLSAEGNAHYKIATLKLSTPFPNVNLNNLDLDLNGVNSNNVVFKFTGATANFTITGLAGGTDGRHIVLYNSVAVNMKIEDMSGLSLLENRIDTLGSSTSTSGIGTIEMVYDGTLQKWIVIAIRD